MRNKPVTFFRLKFKHSNKLKNFNAKLRYKYVKGLIIRALDNALYEVVNVSGKTVGVFHVKQIFRVEKEIKRT